MNWKFWNHRYYSITCYTLAVVLISITYWKSFDSEQAFVIMPLLWPFIIGLSLAYLLNFLLRFYERKIKKRALALLAVYSTVVTLLLAFVFFLAPQVMNAMAHFTEEFPDYSEQIIKQIETQLARFHLTEAHVKTVVNSIDALIARFVTFNQNLVPLLMENLMVIGETLKHITLGVILSIYILATKEMLIRQFKLVIIAFMRKEQGKTFLTWVNKAHQIFAKFLAGMVLNSLIVGILTTIMLFIFRIPFAILIGFIVALTNIIPIFGPFIGAIPSAVMIFFISPTKALIFTVIILVIQQLDANVITPKILGDQIGISSIWVLVSILIFGHTFGILGMILGVPVTALLIEILRAIILAKIYKKRYNNQIERAP